MEHCNNLHVIDSEYNHYENNVCVSKAMILLNRFDCLLTIPPDSPYYELDEFYDKVTKYKRREQINYYDNILKIRSNEIYNVEYYELFVMRNDTIVKTNKGYYVMKEDKIIKWDLYDEILKIEYLSGIDKYMIFVNLNGYESSTVLFFVLCLKDVEFMYTIRTFSELICKIECEDESNSMYYKTDTLPKFSTKEDVVVYMFQNNVFISETCQPYRLYFKNLDSDNYFSIEIGESHVYLGDKDGNVHIFGT